jgi:hypothetical protein
VVEANAAAAETKSKATLPVSLPAPGAKSGKQAETVKKVKKAKPAAQKK